MPYGRVTVLLEIDQLILDSLISNSDWHPGYAGDYSAP